MCSWQTQLFLAADMTLSFNAAFRLPAPRAPSHRWLFPLISSAVVAIAAVFALVVYDARADARRKAEASETNLTTALSHDMERNVELLDLSVQAARDAWAAPRIRALEPDLRQMVVFDHSATARYIGAILVLDRTGAVVADSRSPAPPAGDLHDADFFEAQKARDVGLFVGRPTHLPGRTGWTVAFSRRLTADDGSFGGVAVGFLDLGYLSETYKHLPLGPGGVLLLLNTDGTILAREPEFPGAVGSSVSGKPVFTRMSDPGGGTFEGVSAVDGQSRLFAYRWVGTLPLIQAVAASTDAVYSGWRAKAVTLGAVLAVLCSGILALLFVLKRELHQRAAAETALDILASTDPLTGLANRRRFFERAEARCDAAARAGRPLSVLMIDADHFKSYNDRYGHVAGDRVLVAIGRAIGGELRGGIDLAARYGGEEFIVLLPDLGRPQAFAIAEAVRTAVARLAEPHERATAGIVTVSTGIASAEAGTPPDLRALVETADAELYRSKRSGRNRTSGGERLLARVARPGAMSA